jgi:hypothetical protein
MTLRPSNEAAAKMALADECHQLSAPSDNVEKSIEVSLSSQSGKWPSQLPS